MPANATIFAILRSEKDPAADYALLRALESADLATAQAIVETLFARNTRVGIRGLIENFHLLDETLKQIVLIETDRLFSTLRETAQSRSEQVRLNTLEVVRRGCMFRASYLINPNLHHRSPRVREAAAETLYALSEELLRATPVAPPDQDLARMEPSDVREYMHDLEAHHEDRRQLIGAIEAGLASFDVHLQPRVVEVALWFLDDINAGFWSMLSVPGSRLAQVALQRLTHAMGPQLVPFAITSLSFSEFRPHVAHLLATTTDPCFLLEWLRQSWRLAQVKIARGAAAIRELPCLNHGGWEALQASSAGQRRLPAWVATVALPAEDKVKLLCEMHARGDPPVRRSAVWVLTTLNDPPATEALWRIAEDSDEELARMARWELARRCRSELPLSRLLRHDHSEGRSRRLAGDDNSAMTLDRYWARFDRLSPDERITVGQQVLHQTPLMQSFLRRHLRESDATGRVRALQIVHVLQLARGFEDELYLLAKDSDARVRGTAIQTLGQLPGNVSRRLLQGALADTDRRVKANAVEAIGQTGDPDAIDDLVPMLASPDNRTRANAVKALLKLGVREAAETLLRMLSDGQRAHRISALWLIDRMGLFTLATRVVGLAREDPDMAVRDRARDLVHRLELIRPPHTTLKGARQP